MCIEREREYLNEVTVYGGKGSGVGGVSLYGCADYGYPLKGPPTKTQLLSELMNKITNCNKSVCLCKHVIQVRRERERETSYMLLGSLLLALV